MVLKRKQVQALIHELNNLHNNQHVQIVAAPVNYVLNPFEGNTNHVYPQGLRNHLQAKRETYKKYDK